MKLLISLSDQSFIATKSIGIFNVSMGLVRGLLANNKVKELHILGNEECQESLRALGSNKLHIHLAEQAVPSRFGRIIWDQWGVQKAIRAIDPDWCLLPKGFPPYFPRLGRTKLACYVHDFNWEYYQGKSIAKESPFPRHEMIYFSTLGKRALRVADLILTSTQFNKQRFLSYYSKAPVSVVGIGFDEAPLAPPTEAGRDVICYISPYPHKRTDLTLRFLHAWHQQRADRENITLHAIGKLAEGISFPSEHWNNQLRIPYQQLLQLQREKCRVSVYASDYEGFGMPPVESLLQGVAPLASDLPPIRENVPECYLFDNEDEAAFVDRMNRLYDGEIAFHCPSYPNWQEVAEHCIQAMEKA